jgi:uncharacterized membrane protein
MNIDTLYQVTLILHIAAGFTSLVSGILALLVTKGGRLHRRAGLVFFWAMMLIALTAIGISIPKKHDFLLMIAIFSFFQAYFGYRAIVHKQFNYHWADILVLGIAAVNSLCMLYSLQIVLMVFGGLSTLLVWGQAMLYYTVYRKKPLPRSTWLRQHIGMMMGAMIASITAFVLVNFRTFQPAWLPWLLPTAVLVPLIVYFQRKYARA